MTRSCRVPGRAPTRGMQGGMLHPPGAECLSAGCCMGQPGQRGTGQGAGGRGSAWGGTGGRAVAMWHKGLPRCVLTCPSPAVCQRFGVRLATSASAAPAPPPPRVGGVERCCIHPGRERAGSGQPWAAPWGYPGSVVQGKCVAATTPAHGRGTPRHREAAKFMCPSGHGEPLGTTGLPWQDMACPQGQSFGPPRPSSPPRPAPCSSPLPCKPGCLLAGPA